MAFGGKKAISCSSVTLRESKGGKEARTSLANFNLLLAISGVLGTWYRRYQIIPKGERNAEERLGT